MDKKTSRLVNAVVGLLHTLTRGGVQGNPYCNKRVKETMLALTDVLGLKQDSWMDVVEIFEARHGKIEPDDIRPKIRSS